MRKCPICLSEAVNTNINFLPTTLNKMNEFDTCKISVCSSCKFGYVEQDFDEGRLHKYYEEYYSGIADKNNESTFLEIRSKYEYSSRALSQLNLLSSYIDKSKNIKILEIGSGQGDFIHALKSLRWSAEMYVFEPQLKAQKVLEGLDVNVIPKSFNRENVNQFNNFFDLVYMSHSLEHFNPGQVNLLIGQIKECLKTNGLLFIEIPNANLEKTPFEAIVPHLSFFSVESIKKLFSLHDFKTIFLETCGEKYVNKITHDKNIDQLRKSNSFEFIKSDDDGFLINTKLEKKNNRYSIKKVLLKYIKKFPKKFLVKLKDFKHRIMVPPIYNIMSDENFSYGSDREFIRVIGKK